MFVQSRIRNGFPRYGASRARRREERTQGAIQGHDDPVSAAQMARLSFRSMRLVHLLRARSLCGTFASRRAPATLSVQRGPTWESRIRWGPGGRPASTPCAHPVVHALEPQGAAGKARAAHRLHDRRTRSRHSVTVLRHLRGIGSGATSGFPLRAHAKVPPCRLYTRWNPCCASHAQACAERPPD